MRKKGGRQTLFAESGWEVLPRFREKVFPPPGKRQALCAVQPFSR